MFADEARFGRINRPRPCWAPIGVRPQVAAQLIISPTTVSTHLGSIYNKLGVSSRTAAARFAVEHGLV